MEWGAGATPLSAEFWFFKIMPHVSGDVIYNFGKRIHLHMFKLFFKGSRLFDFTIINACTGKRTSIFVFNFGPQSQFPTSPVVTH